VRRVQAVGSQGVVSHSGQGSYSTSLSVTVRDCKLIVEFCFRLACKVFELLSRKVESIDNIWTILRVSRKVYESQWGICMSRAQRRCLCRASLGQWTIAGTTYCFTCPLPHGPTFTFAQQNLGRSTATSVNHLKGSDTHLCCNNLAKPEDLGESRPTFSSTPQVRCIPGPWATAIRLINLCSNHGFQFCSVNHTVQAS
jgi:hypothetical protein